MRGPWSVGETLSLRSAACDPRMKPPAVVAALEQALRQLGVRVRRERGGFRGGLCVVAGEPVLVLWGDVYCQVDLDETGCLTTPSSERLRRMGVEPAP